MLEVGARPHHDLRAVGDRGDRGLDRAELVGHEVGAWKLAFIGHAVGVEIGARARIDVAGVGHAVAVAVLLGGTRDRPHDPVALGKQVLEEAVLDRLEVEVVRIDRLEGAHEPAAAREVRGIPVARGREVGAREFDVDHDPDEVGRAWRTHLDRRDLEAHHDVGIVHARLDHDRAACEHLRVGGFAVAVGIGPDVEGDRLSDRGASEGGLDRGDRLEARLDGELVQPRHPRAVGAHADVAFAVVDRVDELGKRTGIEHAVVVAVRAAAVGEVALVGHAVAVAVAAGAGGDVLIVRDAVCIAVLRWGVEQLVDRNDPRRHPHLVDRAAQELVERARGVPPCSEQERSAVDRASFRAEGNRLEGAVEAEADRPRLHIAGDADEVPLEIGDLEMARHAPLPAAVAEGDLELAAGEAARLAVGGAGRVVAALHADRIVGGAVAGDRLLLAEVLTLSGAARIGELIELHPRFDGEAARWAEGKQPAGIRYLDDAATARALPVEVERPQVGLIGEGHRVDRNGRGPEWERVQRAGEAVRPGVLHHEACGLLEAPVALGGSHAREADRGEQETEKTRKKDRRSRHRGDSVGPGRAGGWRNSGRFETCERHPNRPVATFRRKVRPIGSIASRFLESKVGGGGEVGRWCFGRGPRHSAGARCARRATSLGWRSLRSAGHVTRPALAALGGRSFGQDGLNGLDGLRTAKRCMCFGRLACVSRARRTPAVT